MSSLNTPTVNKSLSSSLRGNWVLKFVVALSVLSALLVLVYVKGETAGAGEAPPKPEVKVKVVPEGGRLLNLQQPKKLDVNYQGEPQLIEALRSRAARPLSLATADFNQDAAPDLVSGYGFGQRGVLTIQRGNVNAFVPTDPEIFSNAAKGILPPSFINSADVFDLPDAPDFIVTGDFDNDGYLDLLTAARGGNALHLFAGTGNGTFSPIQDVALEATVTSLTAGAFSHPRGTTMSVVVAVNGDGGPAARIYTSDTENRFGQQVASYPLPGAASSIQIGLLDEDPFFDLAIGAGEEIVIVHGHKIPRPGQEPAFDAPSRLENVRLSQPATEVVIGNFIDDRAGRAEVAVLSNDGNVQYLQRGQLEAPDSLAVPDEELPATLLEIRSQQVERMKARARVPEWQDGQKQWVKSELPAVNVARGGNVKVTKMPGATDDLMVLDRTSGQLNVVDAQAGDTRSALSSPVRSSKGNVTALTSDSPAVGVLSMPQKVNGTRDYVLLTEGETQAIIIPDQAGTTFNVNRTTDSFRTPIANQCNNVADDCSLREAVIKANTISAPFAGPGHLINVPSGTYNLSVANPNTPSTTGTAGFNDLQIGSAINLNTTVMGTGGTKPIINQTIAGNDTITTGFTGNAFPNNLSIIALSLQNLDVRGATFSGIFVGADNGSGGVTTSLINNCNVQGNSGANGTFGQGGGIQSATAHLTVTNTTFSSNIAPHADFGQGGAIAFIILNSSGQGSTGNLLVDNCTFTSNTAAVKDNFPAGGAISIGIARAANTSSVTDTTFTTNAASGGGDGGAIANFSNNTLVANRNRFRGNTVTATGVGTGLHNQSNANVNGENNWWGCDAFPTAAPCDTATNSNALFPVDSNPRIDLKLTASPSTICRSPATSTITADVRQNTDNVNVNGGNAPDVLVNLTLTFAPGSLGGTISAPLTGAIPVGGTVARTYTAPAVHGTDNPSVLLDVGTAQTVNIIIPDTFTSAQNGNFDVATTWTPQCVPQSDDSVIIASPHTVTLQSNDDIADVTINAGGTLATQTFNLNVNSTNNLKNYAVVNTWTGNGSLTGTGAGTITFNGAALTQTIAGTTTFNNLTLSGSGTKAFGTSQNSIASTFSAGGGTMDGGTSTFTFTGNPSSIAGANAKSFFNLVINAGAVTSNTTGGNTTINNNFTNNGTFTQASTLTTTFAGTTHALAGTGTTTFGIITINGSNTVNAGSHNFTFVGTPFTITGTFNGQTGTVTAGGAAAQTIAGAGAKNFNNLVINNAAGVTLSTAASIGGTGTLFLTSGNFANGANLTLGNGATISRSGGTLGAAPTFTTSANVIYTAPSPPAAITTGVELPTSTTVLNNLTINNPSNVNLNANATVNGTLTLTSGAFNVGTNTLTLNNGTSVGTGTLTSALTGTVNYNQIAGGQAVLAADYGNLTFTNGTKVLAPTGTIGVANIFTPVAGAHTITGSTFNFNGTGAQTVPAFNYNNLTISGSRGANNVTFAGAGTIGIAGIFNPAASFAGGNYVVTNSTINYNGTGAQDIIAFNYHNLTISGARGINNVTLANTGTIRIAGTFLAPATFAGGAYVLTGSTVEYNGTSAQTMPSTFTTYNNLHLNNLAGVTGFAGLTVQGLLEVITGTFTSSSTYNNVQIDAAGTLAGTNATTINVGGNWVNNGAFTANGNTVNFNGSGSQTISGSSATTFNNLTVSNATGLAMSNDNAVNGVLALTSGDITVAATKILTMPASGTSSGGFDVIGSVKRTGFVSGGSALSFGNPFNSIKIDSGTAPTDIVVNLTKAAPGAFPSAVLRTYGITPNGGSPNATVRLHYLDGELNGNAEGQLDLWRFNGSVFVDEQQSARDAVNNWVEKNNITTFSDWTLAAHINQAPSITPATTVVNAQTTSGLVITANAVDGALVTHFKITNITNGTLFKNDGLTQINNNDFITLAEGNAGLKFSPTPNSIAAGSFNAQSSSDATGTGLSAAATGNITVNQGATTTTITLDDPDPSATNAVVTVNFSVVVNAPSSGTATGNVVITVNDASGDTCNGNLAAGVGTCNLTLTTSGSKVLTATYGGDTLFAGSADTEPHVVEGPPTAVDDNYSSLKGSTLNVPAPGVLTNDTGGPTDVTAIAGGATTAGGTVTLNTNGSFTYNPPTAVFTGADSFTYTANNAFGSDTATVNINVVDAFFINEILFNPTGTDAPNEYIELRGPASSAIPAGTYLVAIEGDTAENPGDVQTIINLSGLTFGSNGYLVLLQMSNTYVPAAGANVLTSTTVGFGGLPGAIWSADASATDLEDDSVTFMLIQTATAPTLTDDIDANDDATADGGVFGGWAVIDSIGVLDGAASDAGYGALTYALGGGGQVDPPNTMAVVGFAGIYVGRQGDSIGSTAASDWVATGTLGGAAPNWTVGANPEPPGFANKPLNHIGSTNFELVAPTVVSIVRASANPTNASSVDFTVTFSESVTGVDNADFALTNTGGIAGASVTGVTGSGATRTVSVNTGTGDGTIRLDVVDNDSIVDNSANPLGGTGAGNGSFTTGEVYTINKSVPTVDITDVTPDPRNTAVSSIAIVFSEAITGFDLADLSLTRNGGANLLTGAQTLTSGDNINWTLGNLSGITAADGNYVLTLTAAGSSITDGVNALAADATDSWSMDAAAPTVDITDVTPDPRNTAVGSITIVFSEAITGFDLADLSLTRDGGANLLTGAQTLTSGDNITWTLGNLSGLTGTGGTYLLTLTAPGGIADGGGNPLAGGATDSWVTDVSAPTVDITDVTPDPRNTAVSSIAIVFSEAVTGFDIADLSLTRDAGANLLTGSQTLTTSDNITWTLGNLTSLTGGDGNYALTLTSGGIADNAGNALAAGASDTWVVNGAVPTVDITDVTPDPRNTAVSSIAIVFSEAVTGFDMADLSLTRDGGVNLLTGAQTLTSGDNINWTLGNLSGLTGTAGTYTLTLTAPGGITDAGGAPLSSGATDSWVMDTAGPTVTINQASGQADPTSASPINFTVVFNEPVANFATGDVVPTGTALPTTATITEVAPNNGTTYNVAVSGMSASGDVVATVAASVATDAVGNANQASTSTDNTVTFVLITNNAPVLDFTGAMSLNAIDEDVLAASNTGTLISDIIASAGGDRITDADAGAVEGIAISDVDPANGAWEYTINNGTNWISIGTPDPTDARLLAADANTRLRFVPNANFNGVVDPAILFRAWDQTSGTNGGTANITTNGGQTAFSAQTETASITVNPVNDPPSFTKGADQVC